jgi:hypothetical protein
MSAQNDMTFDQMVRRSVYHQAITKGELPSIAATATALSSTPEQVRAAFQRLADAHVLVLQQVTGEVLMANPFSAVPTFFLVTSGRRSWYGNCIWDALGIPAMVGRDAVVHASCGCCNTAMDLTIRDGRLIERNGIAYFAVAAKHWWDDIVFT